MSNKDSAVGLFPIKLVCTGLVFGVAYPFTTRVHNSYHMSISENAKNTMGIKSLL